MEESNTLTIANDTPFGCDDDYEPMDTSSSYLCLEWNAIALRSLLLNLSLIDAC